MIVLLDEVRSPTLRETLSVLLTRASHADFAVAELRLAGLDLSVLGQRPDQRFRVLVRHFNAEFAYDASTAAPGSAIRNRIERLRELATSGRVEVRAARPAGSRNSGSAPTTSCRSSSRSSTTH